jgi:diguanylate cyclase
MTFSSKGAALMADVALFLCVGGFVASITWLRNGHILPVDFTTLWSWSAQSWDSTILDAAGQTIRIVYESFAMARNLMVIALCGVGLIWGVFRLSELFQKAEPSINSLPAQQLAVARQQLDAELAAIVNLVQSHLAKNKSYSEALERGRKQLAPSGSQEQIRAAILLLIAENDQMLRATKKYEQKLEESRSEIAQLRTALAATRELNERDSPTKLYTRRHFETAIAKAISEADQQLATLSLIMAEIDHFKITNDTYGHLIGDEVIKNFANIMSGTVKSRDTVARFGGKELANILSDTSINGAVSGAEEIRKQISAKQWVVKGGPTLGSITASFRVAQFHAGESAESLIQRADAKLYVSKAAGRNRVTRECGKQRSMRSLLTISSDVRPDLLIYGTAAFNAAPMVANETVPGWRHFRCAQQAANEDSPGEPAIKNAGS